MKKKENIQNELEQFAPFLAKQKNRPSPFKVPNGYFDKLDLQVIEQITSASQKDAPTKIRSLSFWLTSAAAVILLTIGVSFLFQPKNNSDNLLADISTEEIDRYISDNLYEFDEDLLFQGSSPDIENTDFSEEEINLYLEDNLDEMEDFDLDHLL